MEELKFCPVMTCDSMLIFESPDLPCAKHGIMMVKHSDLPIRKHIYRYLKSKILGYKYATHKRSANAKQ